MCLVSWARCWEIQVCGIPQHALSGKVHQRSLRNASKYGTNVELVEE